MRTERVPVCGKCQMIPCFCEEIGRLKWPYSSPPSEVDRLRKRIADLEAALRAADIELAGMWSHSEEARASMPQTWYVRASEILRAAASLGEQRDG